MRQKYFLDVLTHSLLFILVGWAFDATKCTPAVNGNSSLSYSIQVLATPASLLRPRHSVLQYKETLDLKARGLSSRGVAAMPSKTRSFSLITYGNILRSILPRSTWIASPVTPGREALRQRLIAPGTVAVHWLDNSQVILPDKVFPSMYLLEIF